MAAVNSNNPPSSGGQEPVPPPIHPFFTVPDLSPDGDFEVLGANVHHTLLPPSRAFFALPDLGTGGDLEAFGVPTTTPILVPPSGDPFFFMALPNPSSGKTDGDTQILAPENPIPSDGDYKTHFGLDAGDGAKKNDTGGNPGGGGQTDNNGDGDHSGDLGQGDSGINTITDTDAMSQAGGDLSSVDHRDHTLVVHASDPDFDASGYTDHGKGDWNIDHVLKDSDSGMGFDMFQFDPGGDSSSGVGNSGNDPNHDQAHIDPSGNIMPSQDGGNGDPLIQPNHPTDADAAGCDMSQVKSGIPTIDMQFVDSANQIISDLTTWYNSDILNTALSLLLEDSNQSLGYLRALSSQYPFVNDLVNQAIDELEKWTATPLVNTFQSVILNAINTLNTAAQDVFTHGCIESLNNIAEQNGGCLPAKCRAIYAPYVNNIPPCIDSADQAGNDNGIAIRSNPLPIAAINSNLIPISSLLIPSSTPFGNTNASILNPFSNVIHNSSNSK